MATTTPNASPVDRHASPVASSKSKPGKATAAMVLGIIGVVLAILFALGGVIAGAIAIGLGMSAKKEIERHDLEGEGQAKAGLVLGIVALVLAIANIALYMVLAL